MASSKTFGSITVSQKENVLLLRMHGGKKFTNVFNPEFVSNFNDALDYVESFKGEKCLVLTGSNKFFSAGLDFDFVGKTLSKAHLILPSVTNLFHRVLLLDMPTIAAIGGHSFGAGPFLSLCCDYRMMRKDSGYICAPEAKMGVPLPLGWSAILKAKLLPNTMRTFVLTSKKFNSSEALDAQIVDQVIDTNDNEFFVDQCLKFAVTL